MPDRTTPFDPTALDRPPRDDGGPAFPLPSGEFLGEDRTTGMSLRDYFAGQAMASPHDMAAVLKLAQQAGLRPTEMLALICYDWADAMLAERAIRRETTRE